MSEAWAVTDRAVAAVPAATSNAIHNEAANPGLNR